MRDKACLNCRGKLTSRWQSKYCSNKCQIDYQNQDYIKNWKSGSRTGSVGKTTGNISRRLRAYLVDKFNNKCSKCGWNMVHPVSGKVPLEIDHIDGNSENNSEGNLQLLCPNCHALTPSFKNLNKGNGRKWRIKKYIKN